MRTRGLSTSNLLFSGSLGLGGFARCLRGTATRTDPRPRPRHQKQEPTENCSAFPLASSPSTFGLCRSLCCLAFAPSFPCFVLSLVYLTFYYILPLLKTTISPHKRQSVVRISHPQGTMYAMYRSPSQRPRSGEPQSHKPTICQAAQKPIQGGAATN
ncbi:hypothetical protein HDV57DRAFT_269367 [Trichoderma longibrachiatum]